MRNILIITFIVSLTFSFENRNFPYAWSHPYSDKNILFGFGFGQESKEEALINALNGLISEDVQISMQTQQDSTSTALSSGKTYSIGKIEFVSDFLEDEVFLFFGIIIYVIQYYLSSLTIYILRAIKV